MVAAAAPAPSSLLRPPATLRMRAGSSNASFQNSGAAADVLRTEFHGMFKLNDESVGLEAWKSSCLLCS